MELSLPKGIMFAAMFVPRIKSAQKAAQTKTANLTPDVGYRFMMASRRSHWFHNSKPQALLIAEVDRIPNDADIVTDIGLAIICGQMDAQ